MQAMNSQELFQRALKVAPGGVHSPVRSFKGLDRAPVFFKEAEGAFLTSVENKKYIDFCQSFGPLILGHRDPEVSEEVHRMVDTAWTFGAAEIYSLELAEWMTSTLPFMEKLRFVSSGTEAVMSALRVARAATGRKKILKFEGCYHGHVDSLLVKAGSGLAGAAASSSAGISAEVAAHTVVAPLNDEARLTEIFQAQGSDIAAVIIEPLPANYGLLVQRPEFLRHVADTCKQNGSLLIFDEVISGFRVGLGGMVEKTDIKPDLVT
ncbi:MAG: aminotransferase class III-fold pyridoxal phosphate-dependent enzyme, partial [Bdellovibrio sp.]|nr:aminotransferase class III-fold pyridoxal phosphate-dependent enzyme [Bdellovibrio sp.]